MAATKKKKDENSSRRESNTSTNNPSNMEGQAVAAVQSSDESRPPRKINWTLIFFFLGSAIALLGPKPEKATTIVTELGLPDLAAEFLDLYVMPNVHRALAAINDTIPILESEETSRPGYKLAQLGARAKYPVVIVPGFVSSGLELWKGEPCAKSLFRQRMWGGLTMAKAMLKDKECWMRHLSLDPYTGLDPPGIKVRSAQGMEAADYFAGPYWVWSKMIENMADVGYDPVNMALLPYDWRLSFPLLEERDGYLTALKHKIEFLHKRTGEKVVLMSHSFGGSLSLYFFQWVTHSESEGGGGGGKDWLEKHLHAFVNIAGTVLGVPKAFPALLSGEMKDTSSFTGTMDRVLETFFGRKKRKDLWCKWGSLWAMLPKGGSPLWGIGADIPNSSEWPPENPIMYMINNASIDATTRIMDCASLATAAASDDKAPPQECSPAEYVLEKILRNGYASFEDGIELLQTWGSGYGSKLSSSQRHTFRRPGETITRGLNEKDWHNPAVMPLPHAPSMKIYCLYGIGRPTERGYVYKINQLGLEDTEASIFHGGTFADPPIIMATNITYHDRPIKNGVLLSDGDGTVPLLSEGYMCASGWVENSKLNPSRIKTFTREYVHSVSFQYSDPGRGGPYSSEHVDILGNVATTEDILKVVTGFDEASVVDLILSDLNAISETINSHPDGGVKSATKRRDKRHLNIFPLAG